MVQLRGLMIFQRVASTGSMSKAAASLDIAQPTVSEHVRQLESELGVVLFRRSRRGTTLTGAGRILLDYVNRSLQLLEEGREAARESEERPRIRLAAPASLAGTLFPRLAKTLTQRGFEVHLSTAHSPQVSEMLLDGRADAGVCRLGPTLSSIRAVRLQRIPVICVARPDHPLAGRRPRTYNLHDMASSSFAIFEWSSQALDLRERLTFAMNGIIRGYPKVSPAEVARTLVLTDGVVSFLPELAVASDVASGRLVVLEPSDVPRYAWELMLIFRERRHPGKAIDELLEVLASLRLDRPSPSPGSAPGRQRMR
jgi:DNA-binding transcriptional LysR family regulator